MENYLNLFDKDVENDTFYKSQDHESRLAQFKAENDLVYWYKQTIKPPIPLEMFKPVITTGQSALKSSMVINGGAAVALLAYLEKFGKQPYRKLLTV
ncbi:hypothetical protein O9992_19380 [Vibrio lentus]|nr:hypothetical protein [Vibrio lentus]